MYKIQMENYINSLFSINHALQNGFKSILEMCIRDRVYAGQLVVYVVLRQHDLADLCKVLRLGIAHPQQFGGGKAGKCNVCGCL